MKESIFNAYVSVEKVDWGKGAKFRITAFGTKKMQNFRRKGEEVVFWMSLDENIQVLYVCPNIHLIYLLNFFE